MKLIEARATLVALIGLIATIPSATGRSLAAEQHIQFLKSLYAGTIHLIRKLYAGETAVIVSKFRKSISDETLTAMIVGHFKLVRSLNWSGSRALTRLYPNYINKYATDYLAKSFDKPTRREIIQFHHEYLAEHLTEAFYDTILNQGRILWDEKIEESELCNSDHL